METLEIGSELRQRVRDVKESPPRGFDPEESEKRAYKKMDTIMKYNERLRDLLTDVSNLIQEREIVLKFWFLYEPESVRAYLFHQKIQPYYRKLAKENLAVAMYTTLFVDPDKAPFSKRVREFLRVVKGYDLDTWESKEDFWLKQLREFFTKTASSANIYRELRYVYYAIAERILASESKEAKLMGLMMLDEQIASHTPLASKIVDSIMWNYSPSGKGYKGLRVGIYGPLGCGKTTLAFYSMYLAFKFVGMKQKEALELASNLITNDPVEIAVLLYEITSEKEGQLPAFVADDIAASISKYWFMDKKMRGLAKELFKALKISRERFGVLIFPADVAESVPKGIRESVDFIIYADVAESWRKLYTPTIFIAIQNETSMRGGNTSMIPLGPVELKTEARRGVISSVIALLTPPLFVPDNIYDALENMKILMREAGLKKVISESKKIFREEEEEEEKEEEEEL